MSLLDGLREIPSDWEIVPVKHLCSIYAGDALKTDQIGTTGAYPIYGGNGIRGYRNESNCSGPHSLIGRQGALCGNIHYVDEEIWATEHALVATAKPMTDNKYLFYLLTALNLNTLATESAQPGLSASNVLSAKGIRPPMKNQKTISLFLDEQCLQVDEAVARHRAAIGKLEEYRRAVISHTVSGDVILTSRKGWEWKRFKFIARVDSNLVEPDGYENWMHIAPDSIGKGNGRLLFRHTVSEDGVTSGNHLFRKGAILYSKVRPRLNKVVIASDDGLCSADMYPISTSQIPEWLKYYMLSDQFVDQAGLVSDIRIKMPKINQQELGNLNVLVPPYGDQVDIVAHLDYQCAAVDDAIDRQNQIIAKLEEYRRSLIHAAVTGRIDCTEGVAS